MLRHLSGLAILSLAACGGVPPETQQAFEGFDPLSAEFGDLAALVVLPEALDIPEGGAVIVLGGTPQGGEEVAATVALSRTALEVAAAAPQRIWFAVPAEGAAQIATVQKQLRRWQDERREVRGRFSVSITGCRRGAMPGGPLLASVYVRLGEDGALLPVQRDLDLRQLARMTGDSTADRELPHCDTLKPQ